MDAELHAAVASNMMGKYTAYFVLTIAGEIFSRQDVIEADCSQ